MNILLILSHAVEEYDQLRLLTSLGYDCFSLGGYIDPAHPHDPKRPPLPEAPYHPDLRAAVDGLGVENNIGAAAENIPDAILDWLGDDGAIIAHHYLDKRIVPQWPRLRDWKRDASGRRIIWRSVGQSVEHNERMMAPLRAEGLERVAYSPKEANIPGYAGHDVLIRFYKDPAEYGGWTGEDEVVLLFGQDIVQRGRWTNWPFAAAATDGLPVRLIGSGSEEYGGMGQVSAEELRLQLRRCRVHLYTGTQPASYTLGLIEAMMVGVPVVSIGPKWMDIFPYGPALFEGHEITGDWYDDPARARAELSVYLEDVACAQADSEHARDNALELFGRDVIGAQWKAFLG